MVFLWILPFLLLHVSIPQCTAAASIAELQGQLNRVQNSIKHFGQGVQMAYSELSRLDTYLFKCKSRYLTGAREVITMENIPTTKQVLCDTKSDGGGWVVFQRRASSAVDFNQNWDSYMEGFGDVRGNFWMGLKYINHLCGSEQDECELRVDLKYNGKSYYAQYTNFYVGNETDNFRLHVSGYSGTAGDDLTTPRMTNRNEDRFRGIENLRKLEYLGLKSSGAPNNMEFSTVDRDNDQDGANNCANLYSSGFWYSKCYGSFLNGQWKSSQKGSGLIWYPLTGGASVDFSEIKLRYGKLHYL